MPIHARSRPGAEIAHRPLALSLGRFLAALALVAGACSEAPTCPDGKRKVGTRCIEIEGDAGAAADAGDADAAGTQDGAAAATCLVDEDGDGFGVPGSACQPDLRPGDCDDADPDAHPEALDVCGDKKDNDCDGEVDEGVPEQCDGEDNDCDGVVDNGFTCIAGTEEVACTTRCGSQGLGTCTASCEPAPEAECTLPAEACNWIDDDCDGVADPNMVQRASSDANRVSTQNMLGTFMYTEVALLPRTDGGAWWLYRALDTSGFPSSVRVVELDAKGTAVGGQTVEATSGTSYFKAAAQGTWIAVLSTGLSLQNDSYKLRLQLFRASDWNLVGTLDLVSNEDDDAERADYDDINDCGAAVPYHVSVMEDDAGDVHFAMLSLEQPPAFASGACAGAPGVNLRTVSWRAGMGFYRQSVNELSPGFLEARSFALHSDSCRQQWLVARPAQSGGSGVLLQTFTSMGASVGQPVRVGGFSSGAGLAVDERCESEGSEVALLWQASDGDKVLMRRWQASERGEFAPIGDEQVVAEKAWIEGHLLFSRGRWFALGLAAEGFDAFPVLFELSPSDTSLSRRQISLFVPGVSGANPGVLAQTEGLVFGGMLAVADVGEALVVGVSRGAAGGNLDSLRVPQDNNPAVAVTYRVTCP